MSNGDKQEIERLNKLLLERDTENNNLRIELSNLKNKIEAFNLALKALTT